LLSSLKRSVVHYVTRGRTPAGARPHVVDLAVG
jgi:hypothetical protein